MTGAEQAEQGRLADNIAHFARALRVAGLPVGPGAVLDAISALHLAGLGNRDDFYWTLHAVFVTRREQSVIFEQAFRLFFRRRGLIEKLIAMMSPVAPAAAEHKPPKPGSTRVAEAFAPKRREDEPRPQEVELSARLSVSDRDILQAKDFAQMSAAEIAQAKQLIAALRLPVDRVVTRRFVPDPRGARIDARRSFRRSLRSGGAMIELALRERATRHPPVVALVDISGSMAEYTRLLLHFMHTLAERGQRVHTFLFATRLTNVTRELAGRDPDEALARASKAVPDWEGGTRIAAALQRFNRLWSRRVLSQGAVVLLFTDGLERDVTGELTFELDRLRRSCRKLVWLNPLLRYDGFEARAAGIRAMLPHVDEFRSIHSVASMQDLVAALSGTRAGDEPKRWLR
ncbi:vWA domain-containing protein [Chelatococcus reniformis]|nr:VWA domain-containing protein [Chelatococcus reniformis]